MLCLLVILENVSFPYEKKKKKKKLLLRSQGQEFLFSLLLSAGEAWSLFTGLPPQPQQQVIVGEVKHQGQGVPHFLMLLFVQVK